MNIFYAMKCHGHIYQNGKKMHSSSIDKKITSIRWQDLIISFFFETKKGENFHNNRRLHGVYFIDFVNCIMSQCVLLFVVLPFEPFCRLVFCHISVWTVKARRRVLLRLKPIWFAQYIVMCRSLCQWSACVRVSCFCSCQICFFVLVHVSEIYPGAIRKMKLSNFFLSFFIKKTFIKSKDNIF